MSIARLFASLAILGLWGALRTYGVVDKVEIPYVIDVGALIVAGFLFPGGLLGAGVFIASVFGKGGKRDDS